VSMSKIFRQPRSPLVDMVSPHVAHDKSNLFNKRSRACCSRAAQAGLFRAGMGLPETGLKLTPSGSSCG
jgi:hypothetical protein